MCLPVSTTEAESRLAASPAPRTGRELLDWAARQKSGMLGWLISGWGGEMGYSRNVTDWSEAEVGAVYGKAVRFLAAKGGPS